MNDYYFTFGCGQLFENCYVIISAKNSVDARAEMFRQYGKNWSMQYNSAEEAGVEEFNLRKILC